MYKNKKSCLIYVRQANSEKNIGFNSLAQQEKRCRAYARENKIVVREVIRDEGSGNSITRKHIFSFFECLENYYSVEFIIVTNPTRLGRKSYPIVRKMIEFASPSTKIIAVDLGPEQSNSYIEFSRLFENIY